MKNFLVSIILTFFLVGLAYHKKALTYWALGVSGILCLIISFLGGIPCFVILATVFLLAEVSGSLSKTLNNQVSHTRGVVQILVNVLPATIILLIGYFMKNPLFLVGYAASFGEVLGDTFGSDIGVLSKKPPINIITLKKSSSNLSGNISLLGTMSEIIGAIIISLIYYFMIDNNFMNGLIIIISSFTGCLCDSFLGASIQVKYQCQKCHQITEKKFHCQKASKYYHGIKWVDNNVVNLLGNICSLGVTLILIKIL